MDDKPDVEADVEEAFHVQVDVGVDQAGIARDGAGERLGGKGESGDEGKEELHGR